MSLPTAPKFSISTVDITLPTPEIWVLETDSPTTVISSTSCADDNSIETISVLPITKYVSTVALK